MAMTLQEFVQQALVDVLRGLDGARTTLNEKGLPGDWISPPLLTPSSQGDTMMAYVRDPKTGDRRSHVVTMVRFDVAVHASTEKKGGGGLEVAAWVAKGKAGGEVAVEDKTLSRIQFVVPLQVSHPEPREVERIPRVHGGPNSWMGA